MDQDFKPLLRPMVLLRTQAQGKKYIVVQDPERVGNTVMLPGDLEGVLMIFDGKNSLRDIQVTLTRQMGGQIVPLDDIKRLVEEMDANLLLDSPRFRDAIDQASFFWNVFNIRKPFHAGHAYEKDAKKLKSMLDGFYESDDGPGKPRGEGPFVKGLLAPHIDIKNGGPTFAWAYREIAQSPPADLYIVLGTAHNPSPGPFSLTRKDYMTPFGIMPTDTDFVDRLTKRFSAPWLLHDAAHRMEHSIEFQVVFLQHALGPEPRARILPVLAGFGRHVSEAPPPWEDADVEGFLGALSEEVARSGKRVTFIVGGDLAHIGPRYGDAEPVIPSDLTACSEKDHAMLEPAAAGDAKGFYKYIADEGDRRNICGLPPLYAMLTLLDGIKGKMLRYDHWFDQPTRSAVTFASMVWHS